MCLHGYAKLTPSLELEAVKDGHDDEGDEGEEGEGEEELDDTLLRGTGGSTTTSSEKLLLHSSSSSVSTRRLTSFPIEKQMKGIHLSKTEERHKSERARDTDKRSYHYS